MEIVSSKQDGKAVLTTLFNSSEPYVGTKIGTKTIAGYAVDGDRAEAADSMAEVWVSHDQALAGGGMFGAGSDSCYD